MAEVWTEIALLFAVWSVAATLLSLKLSRKRALDLACMGLLIYLMIDSAIQGEYSLRYLAG